MFFRHFLIAGLLGMSIAPMAQAQSNEGTLPKLFLELNAMQNVEGACRLTFFAQNGTQSDIEKAVFETVIFDASGGVVSLTLFNFRDLPMNRPRVRQFDVPGMACEGVGKALINGANSCVVSATESAICDEALSLESRLSVELLG